MPDPQIAALQRKLEKQRQEIARLTRVIEDRDRVARDLRHDLFKAQARIKQMEKADG